MSQSLFYRILTIVLCSFLPALALVAVQLYDTAALDESLANADAAARGSLMAQRYEQLIADARSLLAAVAADVAANDGAACDRHLGRVLTAQPAFSSVIRLRRDGLVRCRAGSVEADDGFTPAALAVALERGQFLIPSGRLADGPGVTLIAPVAGGAAKSEDVLAADLRLPPLGTLFRREGISTGAGAMVTVGGRVIDSDHTEAWGARPGNPLPPELVDAGERARGAVTDTDALGGEKLLFARIPFGPAEADMNILQLIPAKQAYAVSGRLIASTAVILAATTVFVLMGTWVGYSVLVARWIDALTLAVRRLRLGQSHARAGPPYGPGELGELALTFDSMAETLEQHRHMIADAHQRLVEAIEIIPEGFLLCDAQDRIVLVNTRFRQIYPATASRLRLGMTFREMIEDAAEVGEESVPSLSREEALARRLSYRADPTGSLEDWTPQGRCIVVSDHRTPSGWTLTIFSDVTEQRLAGEELRTRVAELEMVRGTLAKAKEKAELALRTKSQFLANMSHELRTPLNAIIGFSEILKTQLFGPLGDARYRDYAQDILQSGHHLLKIINDLLDMSKIEAGKMALHDEPVELLSLIADCVRLLESRAKEQDVELVLSAQAQMPLIRADELRLKQALLNIVSNAVKFTGWGGSVTIDCRTAPNGDLVISVSDTGIGMTADGIRTALEPFSQIDNALNRRFDGTGLGLPLANEFMKLHGGRLEIESRLGAGTTVRLILPVERILAKHAA